MVKLNDYVWTLVAFVFAAWRPEVDGVKIGIICDVSPNSWQYLFKVASAISIAQDRLVQEGVIQKDTITSIIWRDTVKQSDGVGNVMKLWTEENVDVIFGSPSSRICIPSAHLTAHLNLPHITWSANSYELADKTLFRSFVRTLGPLSESGAVLVTLFKDLGWENIGLMYIDYGVCLYSASGLKNAFAENQLTISQTIAYPPNTVLTDDVIDGYLHSIMQTSRIIFICVSETRHFLIRACTLGMCNGDYLFLWTDITMPSRRPWEAGDEYDVIVKEAYKNLIQIITADWKDDEGRRKLEEFKVQVIERMSDPPWNNSYARDNGIEADTSAKNLYNAMYLYGLWLNYTATNNIDIKDGAGWLEFCKNRSFEGIDGPCDIGNNGDRIPYFWLYQFIGDDVNPEIVAISERKNTRIRALTGFRWNTGDGNPPLDVPMCGFFGELCHPEAASKIRSGTPGVKMAKPGCQTHVEQSWRKGRTVSDNIKTGNNGVENNFFPDNETEVIVGSVSVLFLLTALVVLGYFIRKRKLEKELLKSVWRVNMENIDFKKTRALRSKINLLSQSTASMTSSNNTEVEKDDVVMTPTAIYKGQIVAMRNVPRKVTLSTEDLHALKNMREMMHDNINPFIGACYDTAEPFFLFTYCPKGSLQEILENDEVQLDPNFKYSLTMDLAQGMAYIHNSKLNSHGRLKSSNCLVDNRWMLKVTDYGVSRFLHKVDLETNATEEHQKCKGLLWTAPELLPSEGYNSACNGTKEGDVYSFAIILHEIFYRMGTFAGNGHMTAKDIIGRIRNRETNPCRPHIFTDVTDVKPEVISLMKMCWDDNETQRPTFNAIRAYIRKNIQQGMSSNIVDVILQRLEKYANNLESLVDQRTQQLVQEKQKSDKLLYRMLPVTLAEKLKCGEHVTPEMFDSATVFFSDIVGFTTIAARSSPIEVVDLLNDLYTCFDSIIGRYDAYKVETIGDAYLVVSGIPTKNGDLHAGVIADMSLDIVQKVKQFKIKHMPQEPVRVRIGNHTGPCCAGIVGLSMPRYCLFGDTVNTASRMESNGESQKIHISEATCLSLEKLGGYTTNPRGELNIKGKGLMTTYWLEGRDHRPDILPRTRGRKISRTPPLSSLS